MIPNIPPFTRAELEEFTKANLLGICNFYELEGVKNYWRKDKIIDKLLEFMSPKEEEPQISVRIRRIYEQNKEN